MKIVKSVVNQLPDDLAWFEELSLIVTDLAVLLFTILMNSAANTTDRHRTIIISIFSKFGKKVLK